LTNVENPEGRSLDVKKKIYCDTKLGTEIFRGFEKTSIGKVE